MMWPSAGSLQSPLFITEGVLCTVLCVGGWGEVKCIVELRPANCLHRGGREAAGSTINRSS